MHTQHTSHLYLHLYLYLYLWGSIPEDAGVDAVVFGCAGAVVLVWLLWCVVVLLWLPYL